MSITIDNEVSEKKVQSIEHEELDRLFQSHKGHADLFIQAHSDVVKIINKKQCIYLIKEQCFGMKKIMIMLLI